MRHSLSESHIEILIKYHQNIYLFHDVYISHKFLTDFEEYLWVSSWFCHKFIFFYLTYFITFWKGTIMHAFSKICNNYCCKYIRIFFNEFSRYIIWLWSFLRFLISLTANGFVISLKLKLGFTILSIWFLMTVLLGWCIYFSMIDVKGFVSDGSHRSAGAV